MRAKRHRNIRLGAEYEYLFPRSSGRDTVIRRKGKARLHHTITLIRQLVHETKNDTEKLTPLLKGKNLEESCRNIWEFVYNHIQYKHDLPGIEQVRRAARTWRDRFLGVDCDCYSVFISSILLNMDIPHLVRITKYEGRKHFQHIYPIVPKDGNTRRSQIQGSYYTIDCVTDAFNYEVPFTEYKDFSMESDAAVGAFDGLGGVAVSGVDALDIYLNGISQPSLPLREEILKIEPPSGQGKVIIRQAQGGKNKLLYQQKQLVANREGADAAALKTSSSYKQVQAAGEAIAPAVQAEPPSLPKKKENVWLKLLLAAGVGIGAYKVVEKLRKK